MNATFKCPPGMDAKDVFNEGLELIQKCYNELLESVLRSFVPKYYLRDPLIMKKWVEDNRGTIMIKDAALGKTVSQVWIAGEYKGSITLEHITATYICINWTPAS